jgi:hypothetical protein
MQIFKNTDVFLSPTMNNPIQTTTQNYLDKALTVLKDLKVSLVKGQESKLAELLQDVITVDEPKVIAIANTVQYIGTFSELVRDNVSSMHVSDRYNDITEMFNSIRDDAKTLVDQLADGKIDWKEKAENLYMKLMRGTPHKRFEKIKHTFLDVANDTKDQLDHEQNILGAYKDFRFAVKEATSTAYDVKAKQEKNLQDAQTLFNVANQTVVDYKGTDQAEKSRLEQKRDEARFALEDQNRKYQLIKDVAENLEVGYNVGDTLIARLQQSHDVKDQLYKRAVTFFETNEQVFTTMDAVYTSEQGTHEQTQSINAMEEGANKGLEQIATLGTEIEKAALKTGYGSTYNPQSVKMLVDSIVNFQTESIGLIKQYREESTKNTKEIAQIVEDGRQKCAEAINRYSTQIAPAAN